MAKQTFPSSAKPRRLYFPYDAWSGPIEHPQPLSSDWKTITSNIGHNGWHNNGYYSSNSRNDAKSLVMVHDAANGMITNFGNNVNINQNIFYEKCCGRCRNCDEFCCCKDCYDFAAILGWLLLITLIFFGICAIFEFFKGESFASIEIAKEVTKHKEIERDIAFKWIENIGLWIENIGRWIENIGRWIELSMTRDAWYLYSFILLLTLVCKCIPRLNHDDYYFH